MNTLQRAWRYLIAVPFIWMFLVFFQPRRFDREMEQKGRWRRFVFLLRMIVPMFLIAYPICLLGKVILVLLHLELYPEIISILGETTFGIVFGIAVGVVRGITVGIVRGVTAGVAGGITVGIAGGIAGGIAVDIAGGPLGVLAICLAFLVPYLMCFFRLPFYLASGLSALNAYRASCENPAHVFTYLQHSSLHWDEIVYLPLPYLKQTLLVAYDEDPERALEEFAFIATERPRQRGAARVAALEIALYDLETRKSIAEIAGAARRLEEIFPQDVKLLDQPLATVFACLSDASKNVLRCTMPIGVQARYQALEEMKANLRKVRLNVALRNVRLSKRLAQVVETWQETARREQERLQSTSQDVGRIDNPYKPGQVLRPSDRQLFVGRRDLAQELEAALSKGSSHPTFLLNGERRMGKSSTLLQLPYMLGSAYIPVFYNLQDPGIYKDTATFLGTLATDIYDEMNASALPIRALDYRMLRESSQFNDAATYYLFEEWLASIETVLRQENRTLLLAFDEFEKLEEAGQKGFLDLSLLLDWFRNVIQYHPRLALLFSGVHMLSEMGTTAGVNWSSYFVNVQTLHVTFLQPSEARQLITRPTPDYPGEEIFGDGVVDIIFTETACHPFLIQAVCSALIDGLNAEKKGRAEVSDVQKAIDKALEGWDGYFDELWTRTDEPQQACLLALQALGTADLLHIQQASKLDEKTVRRTLQTLLRRDLVRRDDGGVYCIATPMFRKWVERNG